MTESSQNNRSENTNYRSILKGTSIFGGVQIFMILINLIRGKFVALFLGPEGMGISSLFNSSSNTIVKASSLGLNLAIVKEVARNDHDKEALSKLISTVLLTIRVTALVGLLICVFFSGWLSELSFGSREYSWQFILLGASVFLTIAGNAKLSILQGLHEVKKLAKASIAGALAGLLAGVPLYYFWREKGIVPAMIILSLTTYLFYSYGVKAASSPMKTTRDERRSIIRRLISIGIILIAGDLIGTLVTYIINIFLRYYGSLESLGLYQAANSISNQYAGVVFSALALDYLPRLSKTVDNTSEMCTVINRQSEIVALLIIPVSTLVITLAPLVIEILLTDSFQPILPLLRWMAFGIALRGLQYPLGYVSFANDNKKVFFLLEGVVCNILYLLSSILFFYFFDIIGLGYALVTESIISLFIYAAVNFRLYSYKFSKRVIYEYLFGAALSFLCLCASFLGNHILSYILMITITTVSCTYSTARIIKLSKKTENVDI